MRLLLLARTVCPLFSSSCTLVPTIHLDVAQWSTQATADSGSSFWKRVSPQLSSPTQAYSMRDAMSSSQSQGSGKSSAQLRASLHPMLRHKLVSFYLSICLEHCLKIPYRIFSFNITTARATLVVYLFDCPLAGCSPISIIFLVSFTKKLLFKKVLSIVYPQRQTCNPCSWPPTLDNLNFYFCYLSGVVGRESKCSSDTSNIGDC